MLNLTRMWLRAVVVEKDDKGKRGVRPKAGTPQGGVISPLLANAYLHWFDLMFHIMSGPANWAGAKLVRYADDFVILARHQGTRLKSWIESAVEVRLGLEINRDKTKIVKLKEKGRCLDFLGYSFRYDLDLKGRGYRYLNAFPSRKALAKEREKLRDMTAARHCFLSIPALIHQLNRHLAGWANYFCFGYPRVAFRMINHHVRNRLHRHLKRRSQRRYRPPKGVSLYRHLADLGLAYL
jgi:RNA-directed DNA polymerase